jgi:hypothetical protein
MRMLLLVLGCLSAPAGESQEAITCTCPVNYTCDPSGNCIPPALPCAAEANATPYPVCMLGCSSGWGDCDHVYTNGCETALNTTSNCGSCGHACPSGQVCVNGACNHCGDGICNWHQGETHANCPADCEFCGSLFDCCFDGSICRSSCSGVICP